MKVGSRRSNCRCKSCSGPCNGSILSKRRPIVVLTNLLLPSLGLAGGLARPVDATASSGRGRHDVAAGCGWAARKAGQLCRREGRGCRGSCWSEAEQDSLGKHMLASALQCPRSKLHR